MNRREMLGALSAGILQGRRRPNFVVLFADDLGYGDLSCYGHPVIRTPNLDRMAEEGMRFTSYYAAASVCTPSRVGLLTGRYPVRAGLPTNTGPETMGGLPLKEITLAQHLKGAGYRTCAIGKWHLGYQPAEYLPTSRGFDEFFGLPYSNDMIRPWVQTDVPLFLYRNGEKVEELKDQSRLTEMYTQEALRFIRASAGQPFFLYLPYAMTHLPVSASSRKGTSRGGVYGDAVETLDWSAGEILGAIKSAGADDNTLVVFASDNGPWHDLPPRMLANGVERWHTGSKGLLRGAKGGTYEGGFRVPGIFRWPGVVPQRQVSGETASTLDLFPTISKAAGLALPGDRKYDGFDLLPLLKGASKGPRDEFLYYSGKRLEGIRSARWKLREAGGAVELFDLDEDPAEMYNRADREPDVVRRLRERMKAAGAELNSGGV